MSFEVHDLLKDKSFTDTIKSTHFNWSGIDAALSAGDTATANSLIDEAAELLQDLTKDIVKRCTITTKKKQKVI